MPRRQASDNHFRAIGEDGVLMPVVLHGRVAFGNLQLIAARALQLGNMGDQFAFSVAALDGKTGGGFQTGAGAASVRTLFAQVKT